VNIQLVENMSKMERGIKISNETYVKLLKLKAELTIRNGETKTFDDVINELLKLYESTQKREP
jgi:predicted CopG family antitoxin